jgi:glycine/serine hydroxymethyltransferase
MGLAQMRQIAAWMLRALKNPDDPAGLTRIRQEVAQLCQQFPVPALAES